MSTTPYQHSDELNTKISLSAVPSNDVVGSAWVPTGTSTGEKKPEPKQELMEHDLEQSHDSFAQEGTNAAPIEEPAVEEITPTEPEPEFPFEEHAAPEVAGPSLEEGPVEMTVQEPTALSKAEEWPGEKSEAPSDFSGVSSSELEALQKLQRLGLTEVEGQSLEALLSLAQSRALALGRLAEARKNFVDGMDKSDEALIKNAYENARAALKTLQEIRYPEGEAFAARRGALAGDLVQVRALLAALDTWWWQRFAEALAEVYSRLKTPDGAKESLSKAEALLKRWPDIENSVQSKAQEALEMARKEVEEGLVERQFRALLDEAKAWIALANSPTDSTAGEQADGALALEYIIRAEAACKAAERLKDEMKGAAKGRSTTALNDFTSNLEKARQRALERFPSTVLERRRRLIAEQIKKWQQEYQDYTRAAGTEEQAWNHLFTATDEQARHLRRSLDELIELIRLDPDYAPDEAIRDLIRRREENRRRSAELVGEICRLSKYVFPATSGSTDASGDRSESERYLCEMWCDCEEAKKLDPDLGSNDNTIGQLFKKIEEQWGQVQNNIEQQIVALKDQLGETQNLLDSLSDGKKAPSPLMPGAAGHNEQTMPNAPRRPDIDAIPARTQSDTLTDIRKALDKVYQGLQDSKRELEELEQRLSPHLKVQPKWTEALAELRRSLQAQSEQWQKLDAICRDAEDLVEGWRTPYDLVRLIVLTQSLCRSDMPSPSLRAAVLESLHRAVRSALPTIRQRPLPVARQIELTLLLLQLLQLRREPKNDALARRAI